MPGSDGTSLSRKLVRNVGWLVTSLAPDGAL